jgi:hypothetical protein
MTYKWFLLRGSAVDDSTLFELLEDYLIGLDV